MRTKLVMPFAVALVAALPLLATQARADGITYDYTGAPYTSTSGGLGQSITGAVTLDGISAGYTGTVILTSTDSSWTFTSGSLTLSSTTKGDVLSAGDYIELVDGVVIAWDTTVSLTSGKTSDLIASSGNPSDADYTDYALTDNGKKTYEAINTDDPGTWAVATPEPSTIFLVLSGLIVLAGLRWKSKKQSDLALRMHIA